MSQAADRCTQPRAGARVDGCSAWQTGCGLVPSRMDLGQAWKDLTGLPMVFAVYAARLDSPAELVADAHSMLTNQLAEFETNSEHRQDVIQATSMRSGFSTERIGKYFDEIVARLDKRGHEGLDVFLHEVCNVTEYNTAPINPVSSS